jgi:hypothetical protein
LATLWGMHLMELGVWLKLKSPPWITFCCCIWADFYICYSAGIKFTDSGKTFAKDNFQNLTTLIRSAKEFREKFYHSQERPPYVYIYRLCLTAGEREFKSTNHNDIFYNWFLNLFYEKHAIRTKITATKTVIVILSTEGIVKEN